MSSPITSKMWMDDSELMLGEPSLMTTGICPMSVFDKFDWDYDILGTEKDALLEGLNIRSEPDDNYILPDVKDSADFGSLCSIFPDLIDEKSTIQIDNLKSLLSDAAEDLFTGEQFAIKEEPTVVEETPVVDVDEVPVPVSEIKVEPQEEPEIQPQVPVSNPLVRIPVKRGPGSVVNPNFSKPGTGGRTVKAVVVCPDRSKNTVFNVVRTTSKGIVIQKTTAGRNLLNVNGTKIEPAKLPIKVNVITPKETAFNNKQQPSKSELPEIKSGNYGELKIKIEYDEVRPETPQSLIGSDEEFHPFSSPNKSDNKGVKGSDRSQDNFMKACLLEEDNLCSESYKCLPPAEVTGQVQPHIPDVFKYTPNSSPTNNGIQNDTLDSFYSKMGSSPSTNVEQTNHYYSKAAANVDHDYGFTCRTPKIGSMFSTESLGIQTPSASEPPTDSDDDEMNLSDCSLLNNNDLESLESSEMDREQQKYFKDLRDQMKSAELMQQSREKEYKSRTTGGGGLKERKLGNRSKKRKHGQSKDRGGGTHSEPKTKSLARVDSLANFATAVPTTGTLKMRLPTKSGSSSVSSSSSFCRGSSPKRKKTGSGARIFSPTERHLHNTNEQVRRIEMRRSFEELRCLVPNLFDKPRAPKVSILQEARSYCDELFHTDLKLQAQATALKCQQDRLRCALSTLRKHVFANRY